LFNFQTAPRLVLSLLREFHRVPNDDGQRHLRGPARRENNWVARVEVIRDDGVRVRGVIASAGCKQSAPEFFYLLCLEEQLRVAE